MANCEDLATKAELQELRDQLNAVIGEREGGGTSEVFQAGVGLGGLGASLIGTTYITSQARSLNALMDIKTVTEFTEPVHKDLAKGAAQWVKVKGSGETIKLPNLDKVSKVAGGATVAGSVQAKAALTLGASLSVLASLASIAANLGLNIATVNVLDKRIEAESKGINFQLDSLNNSMLRLYDKQQGNIDAVVADLDANQAVAQQNAQNIELARFDISNLQQANNELGNQINDAQQLINQLQNDQQALVTEFNNAQIETQEVIDGINGQIVQITQQLTQAQELINTNQSVIASQGERIAQLETSVNDILSKIDALDVDHANLRDEFIKLKEELAGELDITNDQVANLESKVAKTQKFVRLNTGGAGGAAAAGAAAGQTSILELASQLTANPIQVPEITTTDIYNNTTTFQNTFSNLLSQLTTGASMDTQQLEQFRADLNTDFDGLIDTALLETVVPTLALLQTQTEERRLVDATKTGICESLNGNGSCPATPSNPNPTQGLKGLKDFLKNQSDFISNALGLGNLAANQTILGIVRNTNEVINHSSHGLAKIQSFAETAWRVTRADKVMNGVAMVMTIHNGMMLSNNLLSTISEATNMTLDALNIRDETDEPLDFGLAIKNKIAEVLTKLLGETAYTELTARIAKANRIYQSSINLLDTVHALYDSSRTVAELTAENTGKIGNALRESGAVYEDAYEEFIERVSPQNAAMRRLEGFREGLENVENVFDTVSQISSNVVETQENWEQLKTEKENWQTEVNAAIETEVTLKAEEKAQVNVSADIQDDSFDTAPNTDTPPE